LLLANLDKKDEIIKDFVEIQNLRAWFWENYMEMSPYDPNFKDAKNQVQSKLVNIGEKYGLWYTED
jgi:hypothetical protein